MTREEYIKTHQSYVNAVAPPFFDEGNEQVYLAHCCGRTLISVNLPARCRTCKSPIQVATVRKEDLTS